MKFLLGIFMILATPVWVYEAYTHWDSDIETRLAFILAAMLVFQVGVKYIVEVVADDR